MDNYNNSPSRKPSGGQHPVRHTRKTPEELSAERKNIGQIPSRSGTASPDPQQRRQIAVNTSRPQTQPRPQTSAPQRPGSRTPYISHNPGAPQRAGGRKKKKSSGLFALAVVGRVLLVIFTFIAVLLIVLSVSFKMIGSNSTPAAQRLFVLTFNETGQLKFLPKLFVSEADRARITEENKMVEMNEDVDQTLIEVQRGSHGVINLGGDDPGPTEEKDIEIVDIAGASYHAHLMIVRDPSRVSVATIYPWREVGVTLDEIANASGAIGAINGGIYNSYNNSGGMPFGVVVSNHEIQYNRPQDFEGLVLIGLTDNDILEIIDMKGMTDADVERLVAEKQIRDAVTFQEEATDKNNHFVQLIINGEKRDLGSGIGSGLNPRTAIGQCADGTMLLLVTDGRGQSGHLGASASDLIDIMSKYGAVNAANLDGGSSTCMYYEGEYLQTSVTFYYSNASWKLPFAFIVK